MQGAEEGHIYLFIQSPRVSPSHAGPGGAGMARWL